MAFLLRVILFIARSPFTWLRYSMITTASLTVSHDGPPFFRLSLIFSFLAVNTAFLTVFRDLILGRQQLFDFYMA
jgi:hypothetical protein